MTHGGQESGFSQICLLCFMLRSNFLLDPRPERLV